jgi:hypothetical protein
MEAETMHWKEIDGVATLTIDEGVVPGPLRACLAFGSGIVDESLRNRGINHVVEHLALHGSNAQSAGLYNGSVDTLMTQFWVAGTPDQVADFFEFVTGHLAALPLGRLDDELRVLQIEAEGRARAPFGGDLEERFGPCGGGLLNWAEIGFRTLHRDDVAAWAHERFTAANAVLWCSGPLPQRLSLAALPVGARLPRAQCPEPRTPPRAVVPLDGTHVGVSFVADASWEAAAGAEAIRQHAFDRLRAAALSYSVSTTVLRLDATTRHWGIRADGVNGELDRVLAELIASVEQLAADGPTEGELAAQRQSYELAGSMSDRVLEHLADATRRRLFGLEPTTMTADEEAWNDMEPESVRGELERAMTTVLAFGPVPADHVPSGWTRHASWERATVTGRRYEPIPGRAGGELIAGTRGVTRHFDEDTHRTVPWQAVAACLVEGSVLHLVDQSGNVLSVAPSCWRGGEDLVPLLEQCIDPSVHIQLHRPIPTMIRSAAVRSDDRWLATVTRAGGKGARRLGSQTVSLVVDTDGIFVLCEDDADPENEERMSQLRSAEREVLLDLDPRNRWLPRKSLEVVELGRSLGVVVAGRGASLRIRTNTGETHEFHLPLPKQVDLARSSLGKMLGRRFVDRRRDQQSGVRATS